MKIVKPSFNIVEVSGGSYEAMLKLVEKCGRICYKSEAGDTETFIRNVLKRGHEAVIEHATITAHVVCDRGVSHEFVRHRVASYCQESTRYCNYSKDKFGNELTFIDPCFWVGGVYKYNVWWDLCSSSEKAYLALLEHGATPQEARSVLPNSLKTEIMVTMNLREWRHFFKLRSLGTTGKPHPQMEEVATIGLKHFTEAFPLFFEDLVKETYNG